MVFHFLKLLQIPICKVSKQDETQFIIASHQIFQKQSRISSTYKKTLHDWLHDYKETWMFTRFWGINFLDQGSNDKKRNNIRRGGDKLLIKKGDKSSAEEGKKKWSMAVFRSRARSCQASSSYFRAIVNQPEGGRWGERGRCLSKPEVVRNPWILARGGFYGAPDATCAHICIPSSPRTRESPSAEFPRLPSSLHWFLSARGTWFSIQTGVKSCCVVGSRLDPRKLLLFFVFLIVYRMVDMAIFR